jgi:hypothetical protein
MLRNFMKLALMPVLALALVAAGCDQAGDVTGPEQAGPAQILGLTLTPSAYTVVRESDATLGTVTGVIGSAGGRLQLGRHELQVPAGAVSGPTTFAMTKLSVDELKFGLTATQLLPNDVGARGFAVPVKLVIDFGRAVNVADASVLQVLWIKPLGGLEAQPTQIDFAGRRAIGELSHFSDYMLAVP